MYAIVGRERFCEMFKGRTVMVPELPAGRSRVLAHTANQTAGPDDASLRTRSEYLALFDLLIAHGRKKMEGIVHYVRMRRDSARAQLKRARQTMPLMVDDFPETTEQLPRAA
jgi:hypothetical protein